MYIYGLLTKGEVKMAGYWPRKERGQCPAILTEQARSIKDLLYGIKHQRMICVLAGKSPYPERARLLHLACSGSQSQREIRFILPARGARHLMSIYFLRCIFTVT